jgi:8-oxo-dGTP diphosphatase
MHPLRDVAAISDLITYIGGNYLEGEGNPDYTYAERIVFEVIKKRAIVDEILTKAAPRWPMERMNILDVTILRMAIYELVFEYTQTHPDIIISEAVSLGQQYMGQTSAKFINGVLATVYREMGSPLGPITSNRIAQSTSEMEVRHEYKGGGFVYTRTGDGKLFVALVQDVWGFWTFPKGQVEKGEKPDQTAVREVREKIRIETVCEEVLGETEYSSFHPEMGPILKHVTYCLLRSNSLSEIQLESSGGLVDAKWFPVDEIPELRMYDSVAQMSILAIEKITK